MKNVRKVILCILVFICSSLFFSIKCSATVCKYFYRKNTFENSNLNLENSYYGRFMKNASGYVGTGGAGNFELLEKYLLKSGDHSIDKELWSFGISVTISNDSVDKVEYISKYMDGNETRKVVDKNSYSNLKIKGSSCPTVITGRFEEEPTYIFGIQNGTSVKIKLENSYYSDDYNDINNMVGSVYTGVSKSNTGYGDLGRLDWSLTFWNNQSMMVNYTNLQDFYKSSEYQKFQDIINDYKSKGVNFDTLLNLSNNKNCTSQESCYSQVLEEIKKIVPCVDEKADVSKVLDISAISTLPSVLGFWNNLDEFQQPVPIEILNKYDSNNILKYAGALSLISGDSITESYANTICKVAKDDETEKTILSRCDSASNKDVCEENICSQYNFDCSDLLKNGQNLNNIQESILNEAASVCKSAGEGCIVSYCQTVKQNEESECDKIVNQETEEEQKLKEEIGKTANKLVNLYENQGVNVDIEDYKEFFCGLLLGENKENGLYVYIKGVLNVIRIGGPILVIVLTAFDAMKTISSFKDDTNKKFWNNLKIRLICLAVLILVPTIINFVVNLFISQSCEVNV